MVRRPRQFGLRIRLCMCRNPPNPPGHVHARLHAFKTSPSRLRAGDWLLLPGPRSPSAHSPLPTASDSGREMDQDPSALVHSGPARGQLDRALSRTHPRYIPSVIRHTQRAVASHIMAEIVGQDFISNIAASCWQGLSWPGRVRQQMGDDTAHLKPTSVRAPARHLIHRADRSPG